MMQREVHITPQSFLSSLKVKKDGFSDIALISGQKKRAELCLKYLGSPRKVFSFSGYEFWTGTYQGIRITVGKGGLYAPDTAIVIDLLSAAGVNTFVRLGSCGSLKADLGLGELFLADTALCGEGTTFYYAQPGYIPAGNKDLSQKLYAYIKEKNSISRGMIWTTDALFRETREKVNQAVSQGASAVDMVSSAFFSVARANNCRSAALLVITDNLITGEKKFKDSRVRVSEEKMIKEVLNFFSAEKEREKQ